MISMAKATMMNVTRLRCVSKPIAFLTANTLETAVHPTPSERARLGIGRAGIDMNRKRRAGEIAKKRGRAKPQ